MIVGVNIEDVYFNHDGDCWVWSKLCILRSPISTKICKGVGVGDYIMDSKSMVLVASS